MSTPGSREPPRQCSWFVSWSALVQETGAESDVVELAEFALPSMKLPPEAA
jgi:hypothetical protein